MSRLIDVDAMNEELFYKQLGGKDTLITAESAFNMIKAQPTAYNVDKVVEEIKVGDVVTIIGKPVVVIWVSEDKTKVYAFGIGGFAMSYKYDECKKTGKHIDIQSVLQQIGGVE